jgi:hypothetical protein
MTRIKAFLLGIREFRTSFTLHYEDLAALEAYDRGRDLAHTLTLRQFEEN